MRICDNIKQTQSTNKPTNQQTNKPTNQQTNHPNNHQPINNHPNTNQPIINQPLIHLQMRDLNLHHCGSSTLEVLDDLVRSRPNEWLGVVEPLGVDTNAHIAE